ncbi:MAG: protein phosphatase 2C domain-containing protein [Holophagales bacterium]|nr:protein phosphatase 2C domain-containing protein [Holophagales bacterium]
MSYSDSRPFEIPARKLPPMLPSLLERVRPALRCHGLSHRGGRAENQDALGLDPTAGLFLVADGVGSEAYSARAAELAVSTLLADSARPAGNGDPETGVVESILRAHRRVCADCRQHPEHLRMATTLVMLRLFRGRRAVVAHLGDSRAYRLRGGELEQLTRDHNLESDPLLESWVGDRLRAQGWSCRMLTRSLNATELPWVDAVSIRLEPGDVYLLCSDGLYGAVEESEIRHVLSRDRGPDERCEELLALALERGANDNVTLVVVEIGDV